MELAPSATALKGRITNSGLSRVATKTSYPPRALRHVTFVLLSTSPSEAALYEIARVYAAAAWTWDLDFTALRVYGGRAP